MPSVKPIQRQAAKITARIEDIGGSGDGIARQDGIVRFIPFGVTGDEVSFTPPRDGKPARLADAGLLRGGTDRISPPCPHHGNVGIPGCGGCRMQQVADPAYRAWKQGLVLRALAQAGVTGFTLNDIQVSPPYSRRRTSLTAERSGAQTRIGFLERGSHRIVDMHTCLILRPELFALVAKLRELPLLQERERLDYGLTSFDGAIDLVIERKRDLSLPEREAIGLFAQDNNLARVSWRPGPRGEIEAVAHRRPLYARFGPAIGSILVGFPPGGFLQATAEGEAALVRTVLAALPARCRTLDLFAGSGTFSFPAAAHGTVHAVDGNAAAIASIKFAGHQGVTAERRDLFAEPVTKFDKFDAVIFDPPYAGAKAQAEQLAKSSVPLIIAISCNPVSFARDAAMLCAGGYRLEQITPVDQFLWSAEVEIAGVFRR